MATAIDEISSIDSDVQRESGFANVGDAELVAKGWNDPKNAPLGYWRIPDDRMSRGRITTLLYGQNALERLERGDGIQLRRYGTYRSDGPTGSWHPWMDPFLAIVQKGGLHEFDAQQIIDLGWHRPPKRNAKDSHKIVWKPVQALIDLGTDQDEAVRTIMPQLKGRDLKDYACEFCPNRVPFSELAHLKNHESLMHKDHVLSRGIQEAIVNAQKETGSGQGEIVNAILELVKQMAASQPASASAEKPAKTESKLKPGFPSDDE